MIDKINFSGKIFTTSTASNMDNQTKRRIANYSDRYGVDVFVYSKKHEKNNNTSYYSIVTNGVEIWHKIFAPIGTHRSSLQEVELGQEVSASQMNYNLD